jgi:hypothetical protein
MKRDLFFCFLSQSFAFGRILYRIAIKTSRKDGADTQGTINFKNEMHYAERRFYWKIVEIFDRSQHARASICKYMQTHAGAGILPCSCDV